MIIGIILYFILTIITTVIFTKYQNNHKEHSGRLIIIFILIISIIGIIVVLLPIVVSANNTIGDVEIIHSYSDGGTVYYNSSEDVYFYAECSLWNLFHIWDRIDIDYELGKSIHDAKDLIKSSEYILSSMNK